MRNKMINDCIKKVEIILNNKDVIRDLEKNCSINLHGNLFQSFVGLCTNANLYCLNNTETDLIYIPQSGIQRNLSLLTYLSLSFCIKQNIKIDNAYPINDNYGDKYLWNNDLRWEYTNHCLNVLKYFHKNGNVPEIPFYAQKSTENLKNIGEYNANI